MTDLTAPFDGYDDLSAADIVTRLAGADDDVKAAVLAYESSRENPRKTILRAAAPADDDIPVPVGLFATSDVLAIPVAGLLADRPELATAQLTPTEWQDALDTYLASPRP